MNFEQININELIKYIKSPFFNVAQLNISPRKVEGWKSNDLIIDPDPKARIKYSLTDAVWLKIIDQLRNFGLSYESIKIIKSQVLKSRLYQKEELEKHRIEIEREKKNGKIFHEPKFVSTANEIKEKFSPSKYETDYEFKKALEEFYDATFLELFIAQALILRHQCCICINQDFEADYIDPETMFSLGGDLSMFVGNTYISINLSAVLAEVLPGEKNRCQALFKYSLNKEEEKVIELIRNKDISQLTVKFGKNKSIDLIETTTEFNALAIETKLTELILKNGYQNIEIKTQNGKITTVINTIKTKP